MFRSPRFVRRLLLALFLLTASVALAPSCSHPTAPCSGNCGSGDIYWDAHVSRCRDHANGQFVKSCCCGH